MKYVKHFNTKIQLWKLQLQVEMYYKCLYNARHKSLYCYDGCLRQKLMTGILWRQGLFLNDLDDLSSLHADDVRSMAVVTYVLNYTVCLRVNTSRTFTAHISISRQLWVSFLAKNELRRHTAYCRVCNCSSDSRSSHLIPCQECAYIHVVSCRACQFPWNAFKLAVLENLIVHANNCPRE